MLFIMVYRTGMQIVADMLYITEQSGQEGIKTTSLLTKANLSHSRLEKFVTNLTGAGLMNKIEFDGKNVFVITPKGKQYLESYKRFSDLAGSFGLDFVVLFFKFSSSFTSNFLLFFPILVRIVYYNDNSSTYRDPE